MRLLRILLMLCGGAGIADTIVISSFSSLNLGVLLPAILGTPLLLAGLFLPAFLRWGECGVGAVCKWIFCSGYLLLMVAFLITSLLINTAATNSAPAGADALIVLGAGLRGERPTLVLTRRLDTAIAYLKENPQTVAVLSGGKGDGEHIPEAEAMARYMEQHGINSERYIKEDGSRNTRENFTFSWELIRSRWGEQARIAFVTTDFHVYRATRVAEKQGIQAQGIAAPDVWYIKLNNYLRECVAVWQYWLLGKI